MLTFNITKKDIAYPFQVKTITQLTSDEYQDVRNILSDKEEFGGYYYDSTPNDPKTFAEQGLLDDDKFWGNMKHSAESGNALTLYIAFDSQNKPAGHVACYDGESATIEIDIMSYKKNGYRGFGMMTDFCQTVMKHVANHTTDKHEWYATYHPCNAGSAAVLGKCGIKTKYQNGIDDIDTTKEGRQSLSTQTVITARNIPNNINVGFECDSVGINSKSNYTDAWTSCYCSKLDFASLCDKDVELGRASGLSDVVLCSSIGNKKNSDHTNEENLKFNTRVKAYGRVQS